MCALCPTVASAASRLVTLPAATPIASYGGVSAWSTPGPDGYRLTVGTEATSRMLPVPPRSVPFDVDLGPDEQGKVAAVYSRCTSEPLQPADNGGPQAPRPVVDGLPIFTSGGLPAYTTGRGCDIYRVEVGGGPEQRLAGASTTQASETLPTIWRDEIAFARVYEQRDGMRDGLQLNKLPYLYERRLGGEGGSRRQPGDSRGSSGAPGPISLDLYGRHLGLLWEYDGRGQTPNVRARVVSSGKGSDVVATVGGGGMSRAWLTGTGFDAGRFLFGVECIGSQGGCSNAGLHRKAARYRLSTGSLETAQLPGTALTAFSADDGYVNLLDERPVVPPDRNSSATCSPRDSGISTVCDLLRVPTTELDYGSPPDGLRR